MKLTQNITPQINTFVICWGQTHSVQSSHQLSLSRFSVTCDHSRDTSWIRKHQSHQHQLPPKGYTTIPMYKMSFYPFCPWTTNHHCLCITFVQKLCSYHVASQQTTLLSLLAGVFPCPFNTVSQLHCYHLFLPLHKQPWIPGRHSHWPSLCIPCHYTHWQEFPCLLIICFSHSSKQTQIGLWHLLFISCLLCSIVRLHTCLF